MTMLSWLLALCGCGRGDSGSQRLDPEATLVRETAVVGFDSDAEPVIHEMSDGSVWIHFEAMPPYFADESEIAFDSQSFLADLQSAAGATVQQDDRERFVVANPTDRTVEAIKAFLESYAEQDGG